MAEISLREYLAGMDDLLNRGASDEVIHHCRQILQYFPQNVAAYRFLGRALLDAARWQEAGEVLRRVLGVYPDDYIAHVGLSEVYQKTQDFDSAVWHLERAFELQPNNQTLITELRELYRQHRRQDLEKLQLTTGAVARQYIRNGLYEQAISALTQSLSQSPERVDLRLLLAETLWDGGSDIEAAETAAEILRTLPNCLAANRILTELWLQADRPSDAQRYLSRIESVDPYAALEIAQGQPVPDNVFVLDALDYRSIERRRQEVNSPDWLQDLGEIDSNDLGFDSQPSQPSRRSENFGDWMGAATAGAVASTSSDLFDFDADNDLSTALPDDWLTSSDTSAADDEVPDFFGAFDDEQGQDEQHTGFTGMLAALNQPETDAPDTPAEDDIADIFADLDNDGTFSDSTIKASADVMPDWLREAAPPDLDAPLSTPATGNIASDAEDPFAWLQGTGVEMVDDSGAVMNSGVDLFGTDEEMTYQEADANPMAWLQGYDDSLLEEEPQPSAPSRLSTDAFPEDDPMAWLQGSGIEFVDDEPAAQTFEANNAEPLPASSPLSATSKPDTSSFEWLTDEDALEEALSMEELSEKGSGPLPPLQDEDELFADLKSPDTQTAWRGATDILPSLDDAEADELDWQQAFDENEDSSTALMSPPAMPPLSLFDEPLDETQNPETEDDPFAWMNEQANVPDFDPAETELPDFVFDDQTDEQTQTEDDPFAWMNQADIADVSTGIEDALPDFTFDDETDETQEDEALHQDDPFAWMSQTGEPAASDVELTDEVLLPSANISSSVSDDAQEQGFDWASALDEGEDEPETDGLFTAPEPSEWLSEAPVADQGAADDLLEDDNLGWLDDLDDSLAAEFNVQPETLEAAETPAADILGEDLAVAASDDLFNDEPGVILAVAQDDEQDNASTEGEMPDNQDDFAWMSNFGGDDDNSAASDPDTPDWLSGAEPAKTSASGDADEFDWLNELPEDEEAPASASANMPDWLSNAAPLDDEPEAAAEDDPFAWMQEYNTEPQADDEDDEEVFAEASQTPDWLSSAAPLTDEDEEEAAAVSQGDEFAWMNEFEVADDEEDEPAFAEASQTPDWLSSAAPLTDDDEEELTNASTDWFGVESGGDTQEEQFSWLQELQAEDEPEPDVQEEAAASSVVMPDWELETDAVAESLNFADNADNEEDALDWMSDFDAEEQDDDQFAISANTPDWLSEAAPVSEAANDEDDDWSMDTEQDVHAPDWLSEINAEQAQDVEALAEAEAETGGEYGWLDDLEPSAAEPVASAGEIDWMDDDIEEQSAVVFTPVYSDAGMESALQFNNVEDHEEKALASAAAPPPAENAPDWLNAMVPGLDLDYGLGEDAPIEQEYVQGQSHRRVAAASRENVAASPTRDFDWLNNIVEEEQQYPVTTPTAPITPAASPDPAERRRFSFSRQPAWLQRRTQRQQEAPLSAVEDNGDLPEWLRDSDELFKDDAKDKKDDFDLPDWL
jgi:hypothetical protein